MSAQPQTAASLIAGTLPPDVPPFYRRIVSEERQGKTRFSLGLEMFDGQSATMVIEKRGLCWCFQWADMPGGRLLVRGRVVGARAGAALPIRGPAMRTVPEPEFAQRIRAALDGLPEGIGAVTGPGRSGAVAAVYASHILGVPFIPFGQRAPDELGRLLIVDTAIQSGKTLRKAARKYEGKCPHTLAVYEEPPRITFWYEVQP